jgi:hypothetical protein
VSERPLNALDALGEEFRRLGNPPAARAALTPRALLIAALLVLLLAGAATAAILIARGAPLPPPSARDLQSSGVPLAATARLAGLDAPDPNSAEPAWDIRLSRTRAGETCTAVGQVLDGQFGIVGLDRVFRALPLGGVDACGIDSPGGPVLAGARVFVGTGSEGPRTVVNGVAGGGVRSVTVYGPDGPRALRLGPDGSFITVYAGYVEELRPRVVVVTRDGRSHAISFAQSSSFEAADPVGGSPWLASGDPDLEAGAYPDENCAQASQELGRANPSVFESPMTPEICGRLGREPLFVLMRRFVPGSGEHTGFPWGNSATRTLVYGAAAPRVASLTLTGAGPARALPIDPHGGVFLAVLDGHVDPRALTLTARLRDGRVRTYTHSTSVLDYRSNRPLAEPPVPAYRNPLAPSQQPQFGPPDVPIADTVRETLRAGDPAGGPEWVLRSWQGLPNPRASFGGRPPARFICFQVGVIENRRFVEPRPGSSPLPLAVGQEYGTGGGCNSPSDLLRFGPLALALSYVDDPYSYAPTPLRTIVSGWLRGDASHPVLLGAGAPRPLALDANRVFMAVLPGRYWDAPLRISARIGGRTVYGSAVQSFPGPPAPDTPQARAPDPNGGAPWGFAAGPDRSTAYGRIVQGRLAGIEERTGTLLNSPEGWSGGGTERLPRRQPPVRFDIQGGEAAVPPSERTVTPPPPQIERRTLPGRTIVTGVAEADVESVTITTPRDVRTLRPSGPLHALIVVYDGQFFRGAITATVRLRDGRTVTQELPNGPGGMQASAPPRPSLATLLADTRRQLAEERRHPHRLPRSAPRPPSIAAIVSRIENRIAYEQAHPGQLPAP